MKKILFLTPELPYPPISGGKLISWKLLQHLSNKYEVSVFCFLRDKDKFFLDEFREKVDLKELFFEVMDKKRSIITYIMSIIRGVPLSIYRNYSFFFMNEVSEKLKLNRYDVILVDHYTMYQYVSENFKGKILLNEHNAEYLIWERLSKNKDYNFLIRMLALWESRRISKYEKIICMSSDKVLCVSSNDIKSLAKLGVNEDKFELVATIGDDELLEFPDIEFEDTERSILFIGTLNWEPNVDGLLWSLRGCWKQLKKRFPALKIYIIGANADPRLVNLSKKDKDIILTGFVENVEEYYVKSRVFVNPLRFGSGIKVKSLNALYRGIPLVTTSIGIEGLDVRDMVSVAVANNEKDMVEKVSILIKDRDIWNTLSKNSRQLAREKYASNRCFEKLDKAIESNLGENQLI